MDASYLHLILNHFPIVGSVIGTVILLFALIFRSKPVIIASLGLFIALAIVTIPVVLTGEEAEHHVIENGISEDLVESHEEAAELAFYGMIGLGVLSLLNLLLLLYRNPFNINYTWFVFLIALGVTGLMINAGLEGGKINHSEIEVQSS